MQPIDIKSFKSGRYQNHGDFKSFTPSNINCQWIWNDPEINVLLEKANLELGGLNSYSNLIPNIDVYIKMHIRTEAHKSNKIEGTKTTIEEDLMKIEDISPEKRDDHTEVQNYIQALEHGISRIETDDFPLSNRLIGEIHALMLQGVRGEHKTPGDIRRSQNWIGGSKPSDAIFAPPSVEHLPDLLSDFEKFIHNTDLTIPNLIKIAILHYQFETIHPFLDGNGRLGRLLIPLFLLDKDILKKPCFYISDYFERNRTLYYDNLNRVRLFNDLTGWIKFFLKGVIETASTAKNKFEKVVALVSDYKECSFKLKGKTENVISVLNAFFDSPFLSVQDLVDSVDLSRSGITSVLRSLESNNIISEITGYSRNRIFVLHDYLNIFGDK